MATTQSKEDYILEQHYSKLCNTMMDIGSLLPYFEQENIIQVEISKEINAMLKTTDKVHKLLQYVRPLQRSNLKRFLAILDIMESHGTKATRQLAIAIKDDLRTNTSECCIQRHVLILAFSHEF